jgi:hypothetical protein
VDIRLTFGDASVQYSGMCDMRDEFCDDFELVLSGLEEDSTGWEYAEVGRHSLVTVFWYIERERDWRECADGARMSEGTEREMSGRVESDNWYVVCSTWMGPEITRGFLASSEEVGFAVTSNSWLLLAVPAGVWDFSHSRRRSRSSRAFLRSVRPRRPNTVSLQHHRKNMK